MSHTATVKTAIKDVSALKKTCEALKVPFTEGRHKVRLFSGTVECDFSMKLPNWQYPLALNLTTGEVKFDNYNGSWGKIEELDRLHQEYALQVVEAAEDVQSYINEGWNVERQKQPNGDVHVVLTK